MTTFKSLVSILSIFISLVAYRDEIFKFYLFILDLLFQNPFSGGTCVVFGGIEAEVEWTLLDWIRGITILHYDDPNPLYAFLVIAGACAAAAGSHFFFEYIRKRNRRRWKRQRRADFAKIPDSPAKRQIARGKPSYRIWRNLKPQPWYETWFFKDYSKYFNKPTK
jgi:hypothetical protein